VGAKQQVVEAMRVFGWDPGRGPVGVDLGKIAALVDGLRPLAGDDPRCAMVAGEDGEISNEFPGIEGIEAAWSDWLATFDGYTLEASGIEVRGGGVVGLGRQWGRSALAGIEIEHEAGVVFSMPRDRIERVEFHLHHATATRAALELG
jgi:hypothetical protein